MKKLKKLSDIPSWFKICKYDKASSLGLKGWYEQIEQRLSLRDFIDMNLNDNLNRVDAIVSWSNLIKTDPIFERKENVLMDMLGKLDSFIISEVSDSVRDFTAGDLKSINQAIKLMGIDKDLIAYCNDEPHREMPAKIELANNFPNKPVELLRNEFSWISLYSVALTANLEASDEQLINDFQSWLKHARTNFDCRTIEEIFTDIDFNDWCEYAILPYFDLTTWAKFKDSEFTHSIMSEAIFPNAGIEGFCGESRVRRETKRRAAEIFNHNASNAIRAQVLKKGKILS